MTIAKTPAKPDETIGEKIDDASITAQVKSSLLSHRSTSALKTKVETTDGVVTLSGIAKNAAEKSLVTKLVTDINGVNSVVNNMTIAVPVAAKLIRQIAVGWCERENAPASPGWKPIPAVERQAVPCWQTPETWGRRTSHCSRLSRGKWAG